MKGAVQDPTGRQGRRGGGLRNGSLAGHALPFWGLLSFALWSPVSIAGANISWGVTLFLCCLQAFLERGRADRAVVPKRTALDRGFALYLFASFLSLCVSLDPWASLKQFPSLGLLVVYYLFAWNVRNRAESRILVAAWFASCALAGAYGAFQYFTGWDAFGHYDPRVNKIGGFFSMHLTFSEYLLHGLCVSLAVLFWARPSGRARRARLRAAFGIMLFGFLLARAKAAYLGLLVGAGVLGALRGRRTLVWMGALAAAPLALLAAWNAEGLYTHFLAQFLLDAEAASGHMHSNTQRLYMWWAGFRICLGHFLNGVGLHAVGAVYPDFRHELAEVPNQWHLHSNFVQLGVTRGLLGLSAFLYLFLLAFRNGRARFRDPAADPWDRALAAGALGACAAFLVAGLTEYSWADSEVLMGLYMVLGLSVSVPAAPAACASGRSGPPESEAAGRPAAFPRGGPAPGRAPGEGLWRERLAGALRSPACSKAAACIVSLAGYGWTRPFWERGMEGFGGAGFSAQVLGLAAGAGCLLLASWGFRRVPRGGWGLFDVAFAGASVLWAVLALATGLLLRLAGGGLGPLSEPFPGVVLLSGFTACLYLSARLLLPRGSPSKNPQDS